MHVKVEWIYGRPKNDPDRARACEKICRKAAKNMGYSVIGIRQWDHGPLRPLVDSRITVYVGHESPIDRTNFVGQGHIYVVYDEDFDVPVRMAKRSEILDPRVRANPEIWI